ncbi:MAG: UvrD-helicase domain-containing protein, partial [Clostridia bacterium]
PTQSGVQTQSKFNKEDIIFYDYFDAEDIKRQNDQRLVLISQDDFQISLTSHKDMVEKSLFSKLYILSNEDGMNFPLLNAEQREIVTIEDKNTLVQGVAGSGKTNICISKIIFAAIRGYKGKVLYTTYSRGLLLDTLNKIRVFRQNITSFISDYKEGLIVFVDKNYKKAVENKLGIFLTVDERDKIISQVESIVEFLDNKTDYFLLEDMYKIYIDKDIRIADENYFIKKYTTNIKNHQLKGKLEKIKYLSAEVIYKEIFGMILGSCEYENPIRTMSLEEYIDKRKDSFSKRECEIIFSIAQDYKKHLIENNLYDNNSISRTLIQNIDKMQRYSLAIIDEVQDMTQVSLCLMKKISLKLFCVGDALQMINPTYFSFAYLKRLLFEKDIVSVAELYHNYRNTGKIVDIIDKLGELNIKQFGTHSFVLKGKSMDAGLGAAAVYVKDKDFLQSVAKQKFDNFTVVTATQKQKEKLRSVLKKQEILTVSEIKGLERDTVILYNILSDNYDKWQRLKKTLINRKTSDENSVYRYYFNLFYVGVSRAKNYLYVAEERNIDLFDNFFISTFDILSTSQAIENLTQVVAKTEIDLDEIVQRIEEFLKHEQYDNARFACNKILDDVTRTYWLNKIDIYEKHIKHGDYREAGISFWQKGYTEDAKKQFEFSKDDILIELVDMCSTNERSKALDIDIIQYYPFVKDNQTAKRLIEESVQNDLRGLRENQKQIDNKFKQIKESIK